jgi:putative peptidoglycan lipid II flippase
MTASYLPVVAGQLEKGTRSAWQLASVMMTWLAVLLAAVVVLGEGILGLVWLVWGDVPGVGLLLGLTAVMLPYMLMICLAAQATATLQAVGHFSIPAVAPSLLNVCWLAAAWIVAPWLSPDPKVQAYVLAAAVLAAGVLQWAVQMPVLRRLGFRFDYNWPASRAAMKQIGLALAPMLLGLAVTQINTFADSIIAWGLAAAPGGPERIPWLGGLVRYPLQQGAAAAIYCGERLYQFPLGIVGLGAAAAIFPLLSRHAARGDRKRLAADLGLGLRLVLCLAVPAGVGLIVLAHPLARLLFEHNRFTPEDTARTAGVVMAYALGVWAYCALPVVVRAFYALGDRATPVKIGAAAVGLNLALDLTLIWPLAEAGMGVATAVSASVQLVVLAVVFSRHKVALDWPSLGAATVRIAAATLLMAAAAQSTLAALPIGPGLVNATIRVALPLGVGGAVYACVFWLLGGRELGMLAGRPETGTVPVGNAAVE